MVSGQLPPRGKLSFQKILEIKPLDKSIVSKKGSKRSKGQPTSQFNKNVIQKKKNSNLLTKKISTKERRISLKEEKLKWVVLINKDTGVHSIITLSQNDQTLEPSPPPPFVWTCSILVTSPPANIQNLHQPPPTPYKNSELCDFIVSVVISTYGLYTTKKKSLGLDVLHVPPNTNGITFFREI